MDRHKKRPFEEVYDEYYDKVYKTVYIRLLNRENTEDIVHDTFLKAMNAYERFDPSVSSVYTWLSTIATNTMYDYFRKNGSGKAVSLDGYMESGYEPGYDDDELEKLTDDYARSAYVILSRLNGNERNMLAMRFGHQMSYKEMADRLSSSEKAVGMKMIRLFDKCRKIAEQEKIQI